jgi:hypothetical protein
MVNFGQKILSHQESSPWAAYYLDYEKLKAVLEVETIDHGSIGSFSYQTFPINGEFLHELHIQAEKIVLFVLSRQGEIAQRLTERRQKLYQLRGMDPLNAAPPEAVELETSSVQTPHIEQLNHLEIELTEIGWDLLRTYEFVNINVVGLRKILKKHDKITKTKLSSTYFGSSSMSTRPVFASSRNIHRALQEYGNRLVKPLLSDDSLGALVAVLEETVLNIRQYRASLLAPPATEQQHRRRLSAPLLLEQGPSVPGAGPTPPPPTNESPFRSYGSLMPQIHDIMLSAASPRVMNRRVFVDPAAASSPQTDQLLWQLHAAQRRLHHTNSFVELLAAPMMQCSSQDDQEDDDNEQQRIINEDVELPSEFSNFLNLMSTFLYMTNYYIVAPTSGNYAKRLGDSEALASIIIGMTPIAALVSTVLYSWWTSYSYKSALLFASTCSVLGNLCYGAGLPLDSITLVMLGRLLNGFGSARSINRRYIADTFSRSERTAASAAFVTAGALGMAAGPAIASALHVCTVDALENPRFSSLYWQAENSPGWFMAFAWMVYLSCLYGYFTDPPKNKTHAPSSVEMTGEIKSLLSSGNDQSKMESFLSASEPPIWRNIPVMITLAIYFALKLVSEAILSAASILTRFYFGWDSGISGMYLAALGLLVLPANLGVAFLSRLYDDRELIIAMYMVMLLGCLSIIQYTEVYRPTQYIASSVVLFISTNAIEGPNMSLLSKTIPKSWSKGVFNVGLLSTEAGTLGRAVGDVMLTTFGKGGLEHVLNRMFGSLSIMNFVILAVSVFAFEHLEPVEKDD